MKFIQRLQNLNDIKRDSDMGSSSSLIATYASKLTTLGDIHHSIFNARRALIPDRGIPTLPCISGRINTINK
jgi:hypothetical protein